MKQEKWGTHQLSGWGGGQGGTNKNLKRLEPEREHQKVTTKEICKWLDSE